MGLPSFFAFLLLFHLVLLLLLLHLAGAAGNMSQRSCALSFNCGKHGQISFPFADNTNTTCGLVTVNCDEEHHPSIALGGKQYDVMSPLQGSTITLRDPQFQDQIDSESCDYFHNSSLPHFPSNYFTILHNLTLFKCSTDHEFKGETKDYFVHYHNYTRCRNYTLYYKSPNYPAPIPSSLPRNCAVIQMPMSPLYQYKNPNNLFELFAAVFSLELNAPDACNVCRQRGGRCNESKYEEYNFWKCVNATEGKKKLGLILGTGASATGMVIAVAIFCFFRRIYLSKSMIFWKTRNENNLNVEGFLKNCRYLAPKRYSYSNIKKMTNSFKDKLGQGGYGGVYKGKFQNGCPVAVKVLNELKGNGEEFVNEVASISKTSHVNVVTLLGFCSEGPKRALIYELMPNGSLEKFVYEENSLTKRQLGWKTLYQIAVGTARGLEYLHRGCNTRILHLDIKPHNILLDGDFCPKISDFGLAKLCTKKEGIVSMSGMRGTAGYIAPEVFCRNYGGVSHKSDVYSYGMMVLEMVGGRKNINVEVDHTSEIYFPHWIYKRLELDEEIGLSGITDDAEKESARKMIVVGLWCIQTDPSNRPSMTNVVEMLEGSLESLQIPPKPFLSSPPRPSADSPAVEIM